MNGAQQAHKSAPKTTTPKKANSKPHICPPSSATHPCDRWETAFVYAFILKFTNLRSKVEGFEAQSDLEEALLSPIQSPVLAQILARFVLNLKPQAKNLSPDQLSATVAGILHEHIKSPTERTVFWNEHLGHNEDPLTNLVGGFWGGDWDLKLRVLRMLVELQLTHCQSVKESIDRAWGCGPNKNKKTTNESGPSQEDLKTGPIAQDCTRARYWHFDESPRLFVSANPWKMACEFKCKARTKEEFLRAIEELKEKESKFNPKRRTKLEDQHINLRETLENRVEAIDRELARVQKVRKKLEQKEILKAQAELRQTRTRRSTRRPDYVYSGQDFGDDDEDEDYRDRGDEDFDEDNFDGDDDEASGRRRSSRVSEKNANGKRASEAAGEWRGERRSTRLGINPELSDSDSHKRRRTDELSVSSAHSDSLESPVLQTNGSGPAKPIKHVKDGEIVVEQVSGKRKSRFWVYAVEPSTAAVTQSSGDPGAGTVGVDPSSFINGDTKASEPSRDVPHEVNGANGTSDVPEKGVNGLNGHTEDTKPASQVEDRSQTTQESNGDTQATPLKAEIHA